MKKSKQYVNLSTVERKSAFQGSELMVSWFSQTHMVGQGGQTSDFAAADDLTANLYSFASPMLLTGNCGQYVQYLIFFYCLLVVEFPTFQLLHTAYGQ